MGRDTLWLVAGLVVLVALSSVAAAGGGGDGRRTVKASEAGCVPYRPCLKACIASLPEEAETPSIMQCMISCEPMGCEEPTAPYASVDDAELALWETLVGATEEDSEEDEATQEEEKDVEGEEQAGEEVIVSDVVDDDDAEDDFPAHTAPPPSTPEESVADVVAAVHVAVREALASGAAGAGAAVHMLWDASQRLQAMGAPPNVDVLHQLATMTQMVSGATVRALMSTAPEEEGARAYGFRNVQAMSANATMLPLLSSVYRALEAEAGSLRGVKRMSAKEAHYLSAMAGSPAVRSVLQVGFGYGDRAAALLHGMERGGVVDVLEVDVTTPASAMVREHLDALFPNTLVHHTPQRWHEGIATLRKALDARDEHGGADARGVGYDLIHIDDDHVNDLAEALNYAQAVADCSTLLVVKYSHCSSNLVKTPPNVWDDVVGRGSVSEIGCVPDESYAFGWCVGRFATAACPDPRRPVPIGNPEDLKGGSGGHSIV